MAGSNSEAGGRTILAVAGGVVLVLALIAAGAFYLSRNVLATGVAPVGGVQRAEGRYAEFARGEMAKLVTLRDRRAAPLTPFENAERRATTLEQFRGQVVVLNLWATWCKPCLTEMPTLNALQESYAGKGLKVVALNVDLAAKYDDARDFLGVHPALKLYHDPKNIQGLYIDLEGKGLPMTVVYDRRGREVARLTGGADWNSGQARAFLDALLAER